MALPASALTIIDGDTVKLNGETIRIANMDAPETRGAKCDAELRLGLVAAHRLGVLLGEGEMTIRRGDPVDGRRKDRHGRTLATISVNGRDVAEVMIAEGIARPWRGKRQPWCNQ